MLMVLYKTVMIYFIILLLIRIMGKREISRLSPFDLVVAIMIAELAVIPIEDKSLTLLEGLLPIIVLVILEISMSIISLKSNFLRGLINGRPEIVIKDGQVIYNVLKKARYNINDLLLQLREKDIFSIAEVKLALLETSGNLSVLRKEEQDFAIPVIIDGQYSDSLQLTDFNEEWLEQELARQGLERTEIILATVDQERNFEYYLK